MRLCSSWGRTGTHPAGRRMRNPSGLWCAAAGLAVSRVVDAVSPPPPRRGAGTTREPEDLPLLLLADLRAHQALVAELLQRREALSRALVLDVRPRGDHEPEAHHGHKGRHAAGPGECPDGRRHGADVRVWYASHQ